MGQGYRVNPKYSLDPAYDERNLIGPIVCDNKEIRKNDGDKVAINTDSVREKRNKINVFKINEKLWVFKWFFGSDPISRKLRNYYNRDMYRFELFIWDLNRSRAVEILKLNGYEINPIEDLSIYMVKLTTHFTNDNYIFMLKNSVDHKVNARGERIFVMKDLKAVRSALKIGAEIYEGQYI